MRIISVIGICEPQLGRAFLGPLLAESLSRASTGICNPSRIRAEVIDTVR